MADRAMFCSKGRGKDRIMLGRDLDAGGRGVGALRTSI